MDILFFILQRYTEKRDIEKMKIYIDREKVLLDQGGDWEKKNRLKVEHIFSFSGLWGTLLPLDKRY